jgi:hypothetical protein
MAVMESHYIGRPVALNECIRSVRCSKDTARKIVNAAVHAGHFVFDTAPDDSRKKLVRPSLRCVEDYQSMVDMLLRLADVLKPRMREMQKAAPSQAPSGLRRMPRLGPNAIEGLGERAIEPYDHRARRTHQRSGGRR